MHLAALEDVLTCLNQAVVRVDAKLRVLWVEPRFEEKTGLALEAGKSLNDILERSPVRDELERAVQAGQRFSGRLIGSTLMEIQVSCAPRSGVKEQESWVVVQPDVLDDELSFARAIQEIARAVGEILDRDAVCAAAVMSMVRCAKVTRAEVYLVEGRNELKRVAVSDVAGSSASKTRERATWMEGTLKQALAAGSPQIGISRAGISPSIFAAVPLLSQRRTLGLMLLHKEQGTSFSARELDLWSAAGAHLAVALENARLLGEAQAALRVREEFMSIASHELKTPLTPLKMSLYTMERKISLGEPVALSTVLKSKRQVDRLGSLVNDLLDVSRVELGKLGVNRLPIDLTQLVVEVAEQFRGASDRELWIQVPAERVWVMGDRDRLEQVLVNLLENAQKYSPANEPVAVTLETGSEDAFLRVVDHGIGIPVEDQDKIFERFHRAQNASHRHFSGLGLGLFISESVMRLHGGDLKVESTEGRGSTFLARLPRLNSAQAAALPRRVLLLEENKEAERVAAGILQGEGFEVHGPDTQESLRNLVQAPLDVIILSTTLEPKIREHFLQTLTSLPLARPIPLLFCGEHVPSWATAEGAVLCGKPYDRETLLHAIQSAQSFEPGQSAWGNPVHPGWESGPHSHHHH